jgi:hypothetical protein
MSREYRSILKYEMFALLETFLFVNVLFEIILTRAQVCKIRKRLHQKTFPAT